MLVTIKKVVNSSFSVLICGLVLSYSINSIAFAAIGCTGAYVKTTGDCTNVKNCVNLNSCYAYNVNGTVFYVKYTSAIGVGDCSGENTNCNTCASPKIHYCASGDKYTNPACSLSAGSTYSLPTSHVCIP